MKKNISINLQGLIFHIEEDGYDVLSRYLAEVKAHFSGYRGHEEIVADIEGRIAELFSARTSATKQIITLSDVQEMVAKMGRVSDFQSADEAEEEEEALAGGPAAYTSYADGTAASAAADPVADEQPRRLYRDMNNRKIAGVAAGIARYFAVNPLWVRLGFLVALLTKPLLQSIFHFDDNGFHFEGFDLGGLSFIVYVVLWIALPKRYDTPPANEDPTFRKLYRDTDAGKIGGVSAGLAAYFHVDVVVIRIAFLVLLFAGGSAIPIYIVLWVLLPEAKTVSDKMRMRGDAVTLSGIDSSLRSSAFTTESGEAAGNANRPLGLFLEDLFRNLRPVLNFIGGAIRIFAGGLLVIIGFSLLLGLTVALAAGLGWIPESQNIILGDVPAHTLLRGLPGWSILAFYMMAAIPALSLLLSGLGLLLRHSVMTRSVGLSLLGLWLLSVIASTMAFARISHEFQNSGEQVQEQRFPGLTPASTLYLTTRRVERASDQDVDIQFVAADSGQVVSVDKAFSAKGVTEIEAARTAATSIGYTVRQANDSSLVFDDHFSFLPDAAYRDQELRLTVHLPRNKTFRISEDFSYWMGNSNFVNDLRPEHPEKHLYRLRDNQLECVDCSAQDLREESFGDADADSTDEVVNINTGDGNMRVRVNTDDDRDGNVGVRIDLDESTFSASPSDYGSGRRSFNLSGFRQIEASGAYRVYVRQGAEFKVEAAGDESDLRKLRVETDGDQLVIRSRNNSFFSGFSLNRRPVLIRVQLPSLTSLDLSGACQTNVAGFSGGNLHVEQSGACRAALNVQVRSLRLDLSGACRTDLKGTAEELAVDGSGACQVNALGMPVERADFDLSGVSKARVRVADRLRAELTGASRVEYAGKPSRIQKDLSGSSRVSPLVD